MMSRKRPIKRTGLHARRKRRLLPTAALVAAVVVLALAGVAAARYVLQYQQEGLATAEGFYFTSDYLKEGGATYSIDPKTEELSIEVRNSADSQRHTAVDVAYKVETSGATVTSGGSGTLAGSAANAETITVKPTSDEFTVTVTSASPYEKVLTATFTSGNRYRVDDAKENTAAVLTITYTGAEELSIPLVLPAGVIPDATDSRIGSKGGTYTFAAAGPGAYSVVLLKSDKTVSLEQKDTSFTGEIKVEIK